MAVLYSVCRQYRYSGWQYCTVCVDGTGILCGSIVQCVEAVIVRHTSHWNAPTWQPSLVTNFYPIFWYRKFNKFLLSSAWGCHYTMHYGSHKVRRSLHIFWKEFEVGSCANPPYPFCNFIKAASTTQFQLQVTSLLLPWLPHVVCLPTGNWCKSSEANCVTR